MMECREAVGLLGAYLALELERPREAEVRSHLESCGACRDALAAADPAAAFALRVAALTVPEDPAFVSGVLAGIHQRRVEGRLAHRRPGLLAAAAALLIAVLGGWAWLDGRLQQQPQPGAVAERVVAAPPLEPAFVEVEGDGVRFYELVGTSQTDSGPAAVKVAFIVDPSMEL
jgi:predicted anti-sigma-YlaC factor YlaD